MFDESWYVDVPIDTAMDRLLQRQALHPTSPFPSSTAWSPRHQLLSCSG